MSSLTIDAFPAFKPFLRPSRYKAAFGGRGSGKSYFFADAVLQNAISRPGLRVLCVREVQKSLAESAKRLIESRIETHGAAHQFDMQRTEIRTPGGGLVSFVGMQDHTSESVKSLEGYDVAWVEEAQTLSERSWELLRPTIRAPQSEIWCSWNPRSPKDAIDRFFRGENPPENAVIQRINYTDNPAFPAELEGERLHDKETKPERYAHIWLGEYEPMVSGAIWTRTMLHDGRRRDVPDNLGRIVVAIDHAVSDGPDSDIHGIVAVGRGDDRRGYVLDDASTRGGPAKWAQRAISTFDKWEADAIVIERNQGGDLVRHTLDTIRPGLPVIEVVATRGKHVRAEPIAALYERGMVSHVGTFDELEDQMCAMTSGGYEGDGSPDRCDALVWAMTELFPQMVRPASKAPRPPASAVSGGWMG